MASAIHQLHSPAKPQIVSDAPPRDRAGAVVAMRRRRHARETTGERIEIPGPVTQQRLAKLAELRALEATLIQSRRKLSMELDSELAAGAEIEAGNLTFDRELKLVRLKTGEAFPTLKLLQFPDWS